MSVLGIAAILTGWLMITPLGRSNSSRQYVLAVLGAFFVTAGMATVIQGGI